MVAKYKCKELGVLAKSPLGFEWRTIIYYRPHQPQLGKHVVICFHLYKKQHYHSNYEKGWGIKTQEDFSTSAFVFEFLGEVVMNTELMRQIRDHWENGESTYHYMECV